MQRTPIATLLAATALLAASGCAAVAAPTAQTPAPTAAAAVEWKQVLKQPADWYGGAEAVRIADNVLLYQHDNGGWDKNIDMTRALGDAERATVLAQKKSGGTNIDNGATHTQLAYLARVYAANPGQERFKGAFLKGLDFLLAAQYDNGGWPQYYPLREGYYSHVTYNDNAMIGVMNLLRDVARNASGRYGFVDDARRDRAGKALAKGIDCILKSQVVVGGKPTAWCAQHDEKTLAPASARSYELVSLSGSESVGIVRFLMGIEKPGPEVVRAVEGAVAWFEAAKLTGIRVVQKEDKKAPRGVDRVVVADPSAPPLWARFYTIGANKPIFCDRDGVPKSRLSEIGYERRNGYAWLGNWAESLLAADYPAWRKRVGG